MSQQTRDRARQVIVEALIASGEHPDAILDALDAAGIDLVDTDTEICIRRSVLGLRVRSAYTDPNRIAPETYAVSSTPDAE